MTKSLEVYIWIMGRYSHYDDIEGKYSGDKYTKQVFKDASQYFGKPVKKIRHLYDQGVVEWVSHPLRKDVERFAIMNFGEKAIRLNNKKVKINTKKILAKKEKLNPQYIKFVEDNKDTVFTAVTDSRSDYAYTFKEDNRFIFFEDDLREIK